MKTRSHSFQLLVFGTAIPFVLLISLAAIFLMNNRPPRVTVPTPKMPVDNGWDDFVRAGEMISRIHHPGPLSDTRPMESWTIPEYKSFLKDNTPALVLVRKGLTKEYLHPPERSIDLPSMRKHGYFREIARTFAGEAKYYQVVGQNGKAVGSLLDCIEFGVTIPKGGYFIAATTGSGIESIGGFQLNSLIGRLTPQELEQASLQLKRIQSKRVNFGDVIIEESNLDTSTDAHIYSDSQMAKELANPKNWITEDFYFESAPSSKIEKVWKNVGIAFANKDSIIRAKRKYYQAVAKEQSGYYTGKCQIPLPKFYTSILDPPFIVMSRANLEKPATFVSLVQTEVALRRYRADHERYPERLTELVPGYLKSLPIDPFGKGKTFKYKPLNNGKDFLLYSLGPNLKDDGGKQKEWDSSKTPGDLVAGKKWTR